jgi:hypothetical protein
VCAKITLKGKKKGRKEESEDRRKKGKKEGRREGRKEGGKGIYTGKVEGIIPWLDFSAEGFFLSHPNTNPWQSSWAFRIAHLFLFLRA